MPSLVRRPTCPAALVEGSKWAAIALCALFFTLASRATAEAGSAKASYEALRKSQPDGRTVAVEDFTLVRDVFALDFASGTFHLLGPVDGVTPGAVFIGEGSYSLNPGSSVERRHLAVLSGAQRLESFTDSFESAVLLFGDDTESRLGEAGAAASGSPSKRAKEVLESARSGFGAESPVDPYLRLLRSRLNAEGLASGPFFAQVNGDQLERAVIAVDAMGILDGEGSCLMSESGGQVEFWYSDRVGGGARQAGGEARHRLVDAKHYRIDSQVVRGDGLEGETRIRFEVLVPELRVLPVDLFSTLEIQRAALDGAESPAAFLQPGDGPSAAIFLPMALKRGDKAELRLAYGGTGVLEDEGTDIYQVRGRTNWYPNLGAFFDRALYDLRFRVPKGSMVVSVGEQVSSKEEAGEVVSVWKSDYPLTVAGFNYGDFEIFSQKEENTGVSIEVYATTGEPDFITEINRQLQTAGEGLSFREQLEVAGNDAYNGAINNTTVQRSIGVSTSSLAEVAMADGVNSVQVFTKLFGPLDGDRIAVTQQSAWNFGQSWPSLVYLPYLMGVSSLLNVGLAVDGYAGFVDQVGIHEIAHQWWGHHVGWATYRDQWLSEGFAEFSTALVLELTKGDKAYDDFWEQRRRAVLGKAQGVDLAPYAAGAMTLGYRAGSARSPGAGNDLIYSKGAFILQMLRALMRDQKSRSDERFFAMLRDFADTYKGADPSTADFQAHLEKHMIPELNAGRDGKMDWFFDQWVYGTEVPVYTSDVQIEKLGKKRYRLHGTVTQSGVSDDFVAIVPTYVDFGKQEYGQFGRAPFKGNMTHQLDVTLELPKKPKAVLLNARHEVLAFDG